jgi:hypothetical protein
MNILEIEDIIKGLPDQSLIQEAQAPSGQMPQFLVVSEIQRRADMRKRFQNQQQEMPQGTIADQIVQSGIMRLWVIAADTAYATTGNATTRNAPTRYASYATTGNAFCHAAATPYDAPYVTPYVTPHDASRSRNGGWWCS